MIFSLACAGKRKHRDRPSRDPVQALTHSPDPNAALAVLKQAGDDALRQRPFRPQRLPTSRGIRVEDAAPQRPQPEPAGSIFEQRGDLRTQGIRAYKAWAPGARAIGRRGTAGLSRHPLIQEPRGEATQIPPSRAGPAPAMARSKEWRFEERAIGHHGSNTAPGQPRSRPGPPCRRRVDRHSGPAIRSWG